MNQVGDDFLAGAAFAGDEDGHILRGDAFDGADDVLHFRAAEDGRGVAAHRFERAPESSILLVLLFPVERAFYIGQQLFRLERFGKKSIGAEAAGFHRHRHRPFAREHDHLGIGPSLLDERQKLDSVGIPKFHIEHHDVGLRFPEGFLQGGAAFGFGHLKIALEDGSDKVPNVRFIVNE